MEGKKIFYRCHETDTKNVFVDLYWPYDLNRAFECYNVDNLRSLFLKITPENTMRYLGGRL